MPQSQPARASGVAARPTGVPRRRHPFTDVQRVSAGVDQLLQELSAGIRSPDHYDRLEAEAQRLAGALVAAFRGEPRPVNPPLLVTDKGAWF